MTRAALGVAALAAALCPAGCREPGKEGSMAKAKFEEAYARWQEHLDSPGVLTASSPAAKVDAPAFQEISALGSEALPHIIEKMRAGEKGGWKESEFFLWRAAERISGAGLSASLKTPSEKNMARAYIQWWDEKGRKP